MSWVEQARSGFAAAERYERHRPGYPAEAVEAIATGLDLRVGRRVIDLGAGTGKLTRLLLGTGARVTAVDPVAEMRATLAEQAPGAEILDGRAEALPLGDRSADAATAGTAWHWFIAADAVRELERVLVPGGGLGLIWNMYDPDVPWAAALLDIRERHAAGKVPTSLTAKWREPFDGSERWAPLEHRRFRHAQRMDAKDVAGRVLTTSAIASAGEAVQREVAAEVREILVRHGVDRGTIELPYVTDLYLTRLAAAA